LGAIICGVRRVEQRETRRGEEGLFFYEGTGGQATIKAEQASRRWTKEKWLVEMAGQPLLVGKGNK
jgi:hypothetical protein